MPRLPRTVGSRYGIGLAAIVVAIAARAALDPWLGDLLPFATLFLSILVVAAVGGRGPALLATVLGGFAATFFFLSPRYSLGISMLGDRIGLGLYLVVGGGIALLGGALWDSIHRAESRLGAAVHQQEMMQIALDVAKMVAWEWNTADRSLRVSENAVDLFGIPRDRPPGRIEDGLALLHPDDVPGYRATFERAIVERGSYLTQYRLIRRDNGEVRWMEERGHAVAVDAVDVRLFGVVMDITDRKRAEEEVRDARSRLASTLGAGEVGTWEFDIDADVVRADENLARMFGVPPEVAAGGPMADYTRSIHPDDRDRVHEEIGRAMESAASYESSYRLVGPGGGIRWVVARGRVVRDETGRARRLPGVVIDTSAQHRVEERLRESEARFRTLFESMDEGFCIIEMLFDPAGKPVDYRFLEMNPAFQQHTGLRDVIGRTIREVVHDHEVFWFETYGRVATTGEPTRFVSEAKALGDRWFEVYAFRVGGPESARVAVLFNDISARKRAEQDRQRFVTLAENSTDFIALCDLEGVPFYLNPAGMKLVGVDGPAGFAGTRFTDYVVPEDRDRIIAEFAPGVRERDRGEIEVRLRHAQGGATIWVIANVVPLNDPNGHRVGLAVVAKDIAERKRFEDDLQRLATDLATADRRKDEFLATLAHELRNPLAPIRNGLQIMRLADDDPAAVAAARSLMERQVTHMVRLIDDLLDVSRITQGKLGLRRERSDLAAIVRAAIETSRPLIEAAGHELAVDLPEHPVAVDADPTRLAQVFANLLNNAAKYTEPGGHLAIAVRSEGDEVVVAVRDDGVGIPAEMLTDVFGLFTQVDRSLERSQGGLGIGLTLVRSLVEMHGGTIEARSEGTGTGSEFVVRLPIVVAGPAVPIIGVGERSVGRAGRAAGRRILVVDDNRDSAGTLARLLRMMGNETRTAYDGGEAVESAEEYRPEVILLDIGMPIRNGYEVAELIRARPWGRDVMLVALTGWGQDGDRRRTAQAGFDHHLVKPVDLDDLEDLLAGLGPPAVATSTVEEPTS